MTENTGEKQFKKKKRRTAFGCFVLLGLSFGIFFGLIYPKMRKIIYVPSEMSESNSFVRNPYCGWYEIFGYTLSKNGDTKAKSDVYQLDGQCSLVLLEINLSQFANEEISPEALEELDGIFATWSKRDVQMIVRFLYDFSGEAKETEPKNVEQVCTHMKQVIPYMNDYKNSIYICQGLFVGDWGEMHSSAFSNRTDFVTLFGVLSHDLDSSVFMAVRTPEIWRQLTTSLFPLGKDEAYLSSAKSRLSLFNDGMLGSVTDMGTYDENASFAQITNYTGKGNRQEEISFQNQLCLYVPNGGEVILDNEYNDIENAVSALGEMRVSYLNMDYDPEVLDKWNKSQYNGENGLNYIGRHLGYRYVFTGSDFSGLSFSGQKAKYDITVENTGFAPAYKRFASYLTFVRTNTKETTQISMDGDNRSWAPGEEVHLSGELDFSDLENGYYEVYYAMKDSVTGENIVFANNAEATEYGYCLGQMTVTQR